MFTTPARSEYRPPIAASTSGVARRNVENSSEAVKICPIALPLGSPQGSDTAYRTPEHRFGRHEEDHDPLEHVDDVFGDVEGVGVDENAAAQQHREQQAGSDDAGWMIPPQQ